MSRHIGRKERWTEDSSTRYISAQGIVVFAQKAWFGILDYRTRSGDERGRPVWVPQQQRLGPFQRPRSAMVALEREAAMLRNRHGPDILFGAQLWADAAGESRV
jgi:hypothetical protein